MGASDEHIQQVGDVHGNWLLGTVTVGHRHEELEQSPLEQDAALLQLLVGDGHEPILDGAGGLDLGLNNGDEAVLLVDVGVAGQAVRALIDGVVGGEIVHHLDAEGLGCERDTLAVERNQRCGVWEDLRSRGEGDGGRGGEGGGLHGSITGFLGYVSRLTKRTNAIGCMRRRRGGAQQRGTPVPPRDLTVVPPARGGQDGMGRRAT